MSLVLANRRKAATVLVALGPDRAASLLRSLDEAQVHDLAEAVATLGPVPPEEVSAVLRELAEEILGRRATTKGGIGYARELLERVMGADRASQIVERIDPVRNRRFRFLSEADPALVANALAPEPPPMVALALSFLDPADATRIISNLPDSMRGEVALRMAALERTHPEVVESVEADFERRLVPLLQEHATPIAGMQNLIAILNKSSRAMSNEILESIEERDPELAGRIRDSLFVFDDIARLDDMAVQQVLKTVDTRDLSMALKDATEAVTEKILKNLSERARDNLLEEIDYIRNPKKSDIDEARKKVVRVVRQLEDAGTIVIAREGEEE